MLAAAVAVAPSWLNWNRYRDNFASLASSVLGRPVRIEGTVSLHLLPHPEFAASRISIADGGDGIAIQAQQLRLRVSLPGLLIGHLDPLELVLQQPRISLPWPFNPAALTHRPDWLSGLSARIEDARIQLGSLEFTNVDGSFAPDILPGGMAGLGDGAGLAARASGRFMGRAWRVMARLGDPLADPYAASAAEAAVPAQLVLDGEGPLADTGASFNGQIAADGSISATVTGRGPDLSQLVPAPTVAWRAEGRVSIADGLAVADNLAMEVGGAAGRAAVALRLTPRPRLDLALAAGRIDLDGWVEALRPKAPGGSAATGQPGLLTGIDLSADVARFHGAALRRVRIAADMGPAAVTLREASAVLPGDAAVALTGRLVAADKASAGPVAGLPSFDGGLRAEAPDLRGTLGWLQQIGWLPVSGLPEGVLRQASLTSELHVAGGRVALDDLAVTADGSHLSGTLALQMGVRPAVAGRLAIDEVTLDPWLRGVSVSAATLGGVPAALGSLGLDADLRLEIGRAVWQEGGPAPLVADHVILDGALQDGGLTVRTLQGGAAGVQAALSGTVGADGRVAGAQLLAVGADARGLRALLPARWQGPEALWQAPLDLKVSADGVPGALATRVQLSLGDARIDASPLVNLAAGTAVGAVTLHHPGAPRLLGLIGLADTEAWLGDGSLSLIAQLSLAQGGLGLDRIDTIAGELRGHGHLAVAFGAVPAVSGQLAFDDLPVPIPPFARPLPFDLAAGWRADLAVTAAAMPSVDGELLSNASAHVTLADGQVKLEGIGATLAGGQVGGTLRLDTAAAPPRLDVQANWHGVTVSRPLFDLPVEVIRGTLDGSLMAQASGYSPSGLTATLTGAAHAELRDGVVSGFDADAAADALDQPAAPGVLDTIRQALSSGSTAFEAGILDLQATPGLIDVTGHLQAPRAGVDVAGTFDLSGKRLDMAAKVMPPQPGAPVVTVRLTGPFVATTRTVDVSDLAGWLAGR